MLRKVDVASYFTSQIDSQAEIAAYRGDVAAALARSLLRTVDDTVDPVALRPTVDAHVRTITGPEPVNEAPPLGNDTAFSGGPGRDQVTVGATNRSIAMGGGDDLVVLRAPALGSGSLDGGAGTDTLAMSGADAVSASGNGARAASIAGFERLELRNVSAGTVNLANLDGIAHVALVGAARDSIDGLVLDQAASGATIDLPTGAKAWTVNVRDAALGSADVLNLSTTTYTGAPMGMIGASQVETVNFLTYVTPGAIMIGSAPAATLLGADVQTVTVKGTAGLALRIASTALRLFDAAGQSGDVSLSTPALAASAVIKGGASFNDIDFSAATRRVEYTGGAGRDQVRANAADNLIETGAGDDEVSLRAGASEVDLGSGNDHVLIAYGSASTIAGGAGIDRFVLGGVDQRSASVYSIIVDIEHNETIRFHHAERFAAAERIGASVQAAEGATFRHYLDAAAGGSKGGEVRWFTFGGDTYVVNDVSGAAGFTEGADQLIKLAGVHDLSASSLSSEGQLTVLFA